MYSPLPLWLSVAFSQLRVYVEPTANGVTCGVLTAAVVQAVLFVEPAVTYIIVGILTGADARAIAFVTTGIVAPAVMFASFIAFGVTCGVAAVVAVEFTAIVGACAI
ncbi:hypothetical protein PoB_002939800 [Plakobranchus ocellatus]|uniref:Uncharacterized protein n=1 Tax=Plakobranchus ocellatus TaxID=259542 RepID=A0AAV4A8C4_9GAST|nr:hypothetical protein PoB_002939800 [Plakobranchus ocellatus]